MAGLARCDQPVVPSVRYGDDDGDAWLALIVPADLPAFLGALE